MSKKPMRFEGKPLQHMFLDLMTAPQVMRGVKGCKDKYYLFLCDPISRYVEKLNVLDKSSEEAIKTLTKWKGEMLKKGFEMLIYLRSDAGTNFSSDEFKKWCTEENIVLTLAGTKTSGTKQFCGICL